jgi:hypothetical protein
MIRLRHLGRKSFQFLATVVWLVPAVSDADLYEFNGTLSLEEAIRPGEPVASASVSGFVSLAGNGGGVHLSSLTLASNLFVKPTLTSPPGFVFGNRSGTFYETLTTSTTNGELRLGGIMPVPGTAVVCARTGTSTQRPPPLPSTCILTPFAVGLTANNGTAGLGIGGTFSVTFPTTPSPPPDLIGVRVFGAPWTEGRTAVTSPYQSFMYPGAIVYRTGKAYGPLGGTSSTLNTSSPVNRGYLQLVTPLRIEAIWANPPNEYYLFFGVLNLHVVPEPERGIGLITAAGVVAMLGARRVRTRRR